MRWRAAAGWPPACPPTDPNARLDLFGTTEERIMGRLNSITKYSINASDEIVAVDGDWDNFALENDSPPELLSENILHRSFWDFISGDALQHVYRRLFAKVRAGETLEFSFRCDSPSLRRFMKLTMTPAADSGIEFVTETSRIEEREFQNVFHVNARRADEIVVACSWCKRLRTHDNVWHEPEDAIHALALFETVTIPSLSHGMCEECYETMMDGRSKENTHDHRAIIVTSA